MAEKKNLDVVIQEEGIPSEGDQESSSSEESVSSSSDSDLHNSSISITVRKSAASRKRRSKSSACNLKFPVSRIKEMLKVNSYADRVSESGAVFLTAVLEYVTAEILEVSLNAARSDGRLRIKPRHVNVGIKCDPELIKNFKCATMPESSFLPSRIPRNRAIPIIIDQNGRGTVHPLSIPTSITPASKKKIKRKFPRQSRRG